MGTSCDVWHVRGWARSLHFIVHVPIHTSGELCTLMHAALLMARYCSCGVGISDRCLSRLLLILTELEGL